MCIRDRTDWDVASQPVFAQVAERVRSMLENAVLVAHNAPFDLGFLAAEWRRLRWPPRMGFTIDTLALARRGYAFRRNNLGEVARSLRVRIDREHRAHAFGNLREHGLRGDVPIGQLMHRRRAW